MFHTLRGTEFLQRIGVIDAHLQPQPAIEPESWLVNNLKLNTPLPLPSTQRDLDGDPPPDRAYTDEWPPKGE